MLNCYVVKDLLPNYVDGLVSGETAQEITEHLAGCADCRSAQEQMKTSLAPLAPQETQEVDFLKKVRVKNRRRVVKFSAISAIAVVLIFAALAYIFVIGQPVSSADLTYTTRIEADGAWCIEMELTNGKALSMRSEYKYYDNADPKQIRAIVLSPRQMPELITEGDSFTYGYDADNETPKDFQIILRLADKDIVFTADDIQAQ